MHFRKAITCKVAIIGAGLAGLGAAHRLLQAGIKDFLIFEAQNKVGGRLETVALEDGVLDLGAQWIHGTDNPLYLLAKKHDLISPVTSEEGKGVYVHEDGTVIDQFLVRAVDFEVGRILEKCEDFVSAKQYPKSVGEFLKDQFEAYLDNCNDTDQIKEFKRDLFSWNVLFQVIDNSCTHLNRLSARLWGTYFCTGGTGQAHINLKTGYRSILDVLEESIPSNTLKLNCPVTNVSWNHSDKIIRLTTKSGGIYLCDHLIVTTSVGALKNSVIKFDPKLPKSISTTISSMGFDGMGKIFLVFPYKWWDVEGIQLVWSRFEDGAVREWTRYITGFDAVLDQPRVLLGWIGSPGVTVMESLDTDTVGRLCVDVLRKFLKRDDIPYPTRVIR